MTKESNIFVSTVVVEDGKVLMIKEGKNNYGQRGTWNFPAGHAEENESLKQAAVRETLEESGFKVKLDGVLAIRKNALHLVVFFAGSRVDDKAVDTEEDTDEVRFVSLEEMEVLPMRFTVLIEVAKKAIEGKVFPLDVIAFEDSLKGEQS